MQGGKFLHETSKRSSFQKRQGVNHLPYRETPAHVVLHSISLHLHEAFPGPRKEGLHLLAALHFICIKNYVYIYTYYKQCVYFMFNMGLF